MLIKRKDIVKALLTEPNLVREYFAAELNVWFAPPLRSADAKFCRVCAVGATLRSQRAGLTVERLNRWAGNITSGGEVCSLEGVDSQLAEGRYLNALSCYFEGSKRRPSRKQLVRFVEKHFPSVIKVEDPPEDDE